jgi:DNA modification methylase
MSDYLVWCDEWIKECLRILKPNGTLYIYGFSEILAFIRTRITTYGGSFGTILTKYDFQLLAEIARKHFSML